MIIETYKPTGILKNYIKNYLVVKTEQAALTAIVPEISPVLSLRYKGEQSYLVNHKQKRLPPLAFTGIRKSVKPIFLSNHTETILVNFKPCEAGQFFTEHLHNFSEESISLCDCLPMQVVLNLEDQLMKDTNSFYKIDIIERFLLSIFKNDNPDKLIDAAVQKIFMSNGTIKIKDLAFLFNKSLDVFEKRFRKIVGTSPKRFSSIVKITSIINKKHNNKSLSEIAYEYGYFDQSHFIKDFKLFTGKTPFDYFKKPSM